MQREITNANVRRPWWNAYIHQPAQQAYKREGVGEEEENSGKKPRGGGGKGTPATKSASFASPPTVL